MSPTAAFRPWVRAISAWLRGWGRAAGVKVAQGLWWLGVAVCAWVERGADHGD